MLLSALLLYFTHTLIVIAGPKKESSSSTTTARSVLSSTRSSSSSKSNSSTFAKSRSSSGSLHLTTSPKKPLNDYPDYDPEYVVLNRELGSPDSTLEYERPLKRPIDTTLDGRRPRPPKRYPTYSSSVGYPMGANYGRPDYALPQPSPYPDDYYGPAPVEPSPIDYGYPAPAARPYGAYPPPYEIMPPGSASPAAPQYPSHYYSNNYPSIDPSAADRSSAGYNSYPRGYTNGYSAYGNSNSISPLGYSYAGYIKRQARRYPIMMYTLIQCIPCQRAKHLLAVSYSDVAAHFLELVGDEEWQRQLQADLQQMTGQITFPYIFICGQHIGGSSDLFSLHQSGQLRTMLNNCVPRKQAAQKTQ